MKNDFMVTSMDNIPSIFEFEEEIKLPRELDEDIFWLKMKPERILKIIWDDMDDKYILLVHFKSLVRAHPNQEDYVTQFSKLYNLEELIF